MKDFKRPGLWLGLYVIALVWTIVASLGPAPAGPDVPNSDKWMHLVSYGLLAAGAVQLFRPRALVVAAIGLVALGAGLEVAQGLLTDNRMMDWRDALANSVGVGLGIATWLLPWRDLFVRVEARGLADSATK